MFWKKRHASTAQHGKLILHVGDFKTGSTSIQYALATGRCVVKSASLSYPSKLNHNNLKSAFVHPLAHKRTLTQLSQNMATNKADFTILSAEVLERVDPQKIEQVYNQHFSAHVQSMQVIAYVRPHAGRISSSCSERIKVGSFFKNRLEDFFEVSLSDKRFFYTPRFRSWQDQFGQDFTLRPMIRHQLHKGSVIEDFLHISLDNTPFTLTPGNNANESLSLRDLMVIKLIQTRARSMSDHARLGLGWSIARHLGSYATEPEEKLRPHKALAARIAEAYMDDAKSMDTTFFGGEPLLQADLEKTVESAPEEEQSLDPADHFSDSEQRHIITLADTISEMLHNNEGKPWAKHFLDTRIQALHRL